jgi:hypothetical protein
MASLLAGRHWRLLPAPSRRQIRRDPVRIRGRVLADRHQADVQPAEGFPTE